MSRLSRKSVIVMVGLAVIAFIGATVRVFLLPGVDIAGVHYKVFGDSFWLVRNAYLFSGSSIESATQSALEIFLPLRGFDPADVPSAVQSQLPVYLGISPRYTVIFESRPLASMLLAPFLLLWGTAGLMWTITVELALAAFATGLLAAQFARRETKAAFGLMVLAIVLFLCLSTGEWGGAVLFEGFSYAFTAVILLLTVRVIQDPYSPHWSTYLLLPLGFLGLLAKSSGLTPVLAIAIAVVILRAILLRRLTYPIVIAGAGLFGSVILWTLVGWLSRWPGVMDSLQDTFTDHFNRPDVSNPFELWWGLLKSSMKLEVTWAADNLGVVAILLFFAWYAIRRFGQSALLLIGLFAAGYANFFVHPEPSEFERFIAIGWMGVAVAGAVLVSDIRRSKKADSLDGFVPWKKVR